MKAEIQEKLATLIENNVAAGFVRGQTLFLEGFEEDLEKASVLRNNSIDDVMQYLLTDHAQNNQ